MDEPDVNASALRATFKVIPPSTLTDEIRAYATAFSLLERVLTRRDNFSSKFPALPQIGEVKLLRFHSCPRAVLAMREDDYDASPNNHLL
jgi:hypothetical protein